MKKGDFLHLFMKYFPQYSHRMRSTLHSYSDSYQNPYHLEDDCWSHTMLVYQALDTTGLNEVDTLSLLTAGLCHDAGKPFVRSSHKPGKINMWNHSEAGTQFAAEVCHKLFNNSSYSSKIAEDILHKVTFLVSHHIDAHQTNSKDASVLFNYRNDLFLLMKRLLLADNAGQFTIDLSTVDITHPKSEIVINQTDDYLKWSLTPDDMDYKRCFPDHKRFEVRLFAGVPGSGKDTLAGKAGYEILSYDKIRVTEFLKVNKGYVGTVKDTYNLAWNFCKKLDMLKLLDKQLNDLKTDGVFLKLAICNTFCTSKSRRAMVNMINKVFNDDVSIGITYILIPSQNSIDNDLNRSDKTVGKDVITSFQMNQKIPTMDEGFDNIRVVFNDFEQNISEGGTYV